MLKPDHQFVVLISKYSRKKLVVSHLYRQKVHEHILSNEPGTCRDSYPLGQITIYRLTYPRRYWLWFLSVVLGPGPGPVYWVGV